MLGLAAQGEAQQGDWLVADTQSAGRGRQGRAWVSPPGNLYASGLVLLRASDPPAPTLALVAGIAAFDALASAPIPSESPSPAVPSLSKDSPREPSFDRLGTAGSGDRLCLKWPNDLLADGAKVAGILLERQGDAVVIGIGVNLKHHPDLAERPTTSMAALGVDLPVDAAIAALAEATVRWVAVWRESLAMIRAEWLARAHPVGTPLAVSVPEGERVGGTFDGLGLDCALQLRLPGGALRRIHVGDVFIL